MKPRAQDRDLLQDDVDLARWDISGLRPGQSVTYWRGFLLHDRTKSIVRQLADEVAWRARAGQLLLTQRRLKPVIKTTRRGKTVTIANYEYLATRRRHA
jgi:hypothetical protein